MAIITDITTILKHIPVNDGFTYSLIKPFIEQAEEKFLLPIIGREFYQELEDGNIEDEKLVNFVERAISNIAFWLYLPIGNVEISDAGIRINSTADKKTAFEWQVNQVLNSVASLGMDNLEMMLQYLEAPRPAGEATDPFAIYKASAEREASQKLFLPNATEFNAYYAIGRSRLTYICLQTICRHVQQEMIDPLMPEDLTTLEPAAIRCIKSAIAYQTILEALHQLAVDISPMGLSANYLSMVNNIYKTPAADSRVQMLMSHVREKAAGYFRQMPELLPGYVEAEGGGTIDPTDLSIFPAF